MAGEKLKKWRISGFRHPPSGRKRIFFFGSKTFSEVFDYADFESGVKNSLSKLKKNQSFLAGEPTHG